MTVAADLAPLIEVRNLKKYYPIEVGMFRRVHGYLKAVDDVSFVIFPGETLGLVGESGSGKTTVGRCMLRAVDPTSGEVWFHHEGKSWNLAELTEREIKPLRPYAQMIFQDPFSSLDPRMPVFDIISEPLRTHNLAYGSELEDQVKELAGHVGLNIEHLRRYPHAFSAGQRQRIGIARALATRPQLIVADEPVSALDVSIQAQILNLLPQLKEEFGLTFLFIAHDLSVVEYVSDRVAVMYVGRLVETATTEKIFRAPRHPYTEALLSAVPKTSPDEVKKRIVLHGETANPAELPTGCYFHPRCHYADEICRTETPPWVEIEPGHFSACHFAEELTLTGAYGET